MLVCTQQLSRFFEINSNNNTYMRTIFVKFYSPSQVMEVNSKTTDEEIKRACFRAAKYGNEESALWAYAETPGTLWSTLLEDDVDVEAFIDRAYDAIKKNDIDWLEANFQ